MAEEEKIRLDKWLWAARFFKTRALASKAINGGKVHLNGQRIKASRPVKIDDCYQVLRSQERFEIIVTGLSDKRGSATMAHNLYKETPESLSQRQSEAEKRKLAAMQRPSSDHKPNKQERRKIRQFTEKN